MKHLLVTDSSRISSLTYDGEKKELTVEFKRGGTYAYHAVPEEVYIGFVNSESKGAFLNEYVKTHFSFTRIS